jgi:putative transposase
MLRTYKLKHSINKKKQKKILAILKEYRNTSVEISNRQWIHFYKNGKFNRDLKIDTIKSKLSKRYKQTAQYQVVSGLESYLGNRQNEFKDYLKNSNFDSDTKTKLYYINRYKKWFHSSIKMQGEEIDRDIIKLSRRIIKNIFKKNKKPNFKFCNMALDAIEISRFWMVAPKNMRASLIVEKKGE